MDNNYNSYQDLVKELSQHCENYYKKAEQDYAEGKSIWEDPLQPSDEVKMFLEGRTDQQLQTIMTDTKRIYLEKKLSAQNVINETYFDTLLQATIREYSGKDFAEKEKVDVPMENTYDGRIRELYHHCENTYCQMCKFRLEGKGTPDLEPSDKISYFLKNRTQEEQYDILRDVKELYLADKAAGWDMKSTGWFMMDEKQFDMILQETVLGYIEKDKILVSENNETDIIRELNKHCTDYYNNMFSKLASGRTSHLVPSDEIKAFLKDKPKEELEAILVNVKKMYLEDKAAGKEVINESSFDTIAQHAILGQVEKAKITVPEAKVPALKTGNPVLRPNAIMRQWAFQERAHRNKDVYMKYDPNTGESSSEYAAKYKKQGNGSLMDGLIKNMHQEKKNKEQSQNTAQRNKQKVKMFRKL